MLKKRIANASICALLLSTSTPLVMATAGASDHGTASGTHLSADTVFSNIVHTPTEPSITGTVTIAADISPLESATDITATVWYRLGTNGSFAAAAMIPTGGSTYITDPPLPRGAAGPVQYYLQSTFDTPQGDGPFHAYAPADGPDSPFAYTNTDAYAAFTEFTTNEGWVANGGVLCTQTNSANWVVYEAMLRATNFAPSTVGAVWLNALVADVPSIHTPWLASGLGAIQIAASNRGLDTTNTLELLMTTNGFDWTTLDTVTVSTTTFTEYILPINIEAPVMLRLVNTFSTSTGGHLGIDYIRISYPAAKVAISNVTVHPQYPSDTDPVRIACDIASITAFAPAQDITARVYYKDAAVTNWSGPIEMDRHDGHYVTASGIPAFPAGTTVDYYVESTFKGYSRLYSFSPATEPAVPGADPLTYTTRSHASSYNTITLASDGATTGGMVQTADHLWEGFLLYSSPTNRPTFSMAGFDYYDGTNTHAGLFASWGDDNQSRSRLPMVGTMGIGEAGVTIPELAQGQYMVRFDEMLGQYSVQRVAFQDFNTWRASPTHFDESFADAETIANAQTFDDWPLPVSPLPDHFDSWADAQAYPPALFDTYLYGDPAASGVRIEEGTIITQLIGQATMLRDSERLGAVITTEPRSIGSIAFDVRCASPDGFRPALYGGLTESNIMITATMAAPQMPTNASGNSLGHAHKSILGNYIDADNYYEARIAQASATQKRYQIWKKSGGTMTRLSQSGIYTGTISQNESFSMLIFRTAVGRTRIRVYSGMSHRAYWEDASPLADSSVIGVDGMDASLALRHVSVFAVTNDTFNMNNSIYEESFYEAPPSGWSDGDGAWSADTGIGSFNRIGYTGPALGLTLDYSAGAYGPWSTLGTYTNLRHAAYARIVHPVRIPDDIYLRIRHTDGNGSLIVDNVQIEPWRGQTLVHSNGWSTSGGWVSPVGNPGRSIELRGSRDVNRLPPFVTSPAFAGSPTGLTLDYRSASESSPPFALVLQYETREEPEVWYPLATVTNITATWNSLSVGIPHPLRPSIHRLRLVNLSPDSGTGILVDNILVAENPPVGSATWWAYNALITDTPPVPDLLAGIAGNIKGAYLNNGATNGTGGGVFTSHYPSVQSAFLPDGIGEIRFLYRAWDTNAAAIEIVAASDRWLPESEWTLLDTVSVTNRVFSEYRHLAMDRDNRYVKLRVNTDSGTPGRVAIDDLLITAPFGADLGMRNLRLTPETPTIHDEVHVSVEVHDLFLYPSNIVMQVYVEEGTGNWGEYINPTVLDMALVASDGESFTYQTCSPISRRTVVDAVVQYQVKATFDGVLAEASSPRTYSHFETPDHYWPVDLNRDQPKQTPYYFSLSCLPGKVWINEFNVADAFWAPPATQYIEVAGMAGINIGNWHIDVLNTDFSTNATYRIPEQTTIAGTDFGFYLLGDTTLPNASLTLTNALPARGGLQLRRGMGAIEHQLAYDTGSADASEQGGQYMTNSVWHRFEYAGADSTHGFYAMTLTSDTPGSDRSVFTWISYGEYSPGAVNANQTLIVGTSLQGYRGPVAIQNAYRADGNICFTVGTESENLTPQLQYKTNLTDSAWTPLPVQDWVRTGTTYTFSSVPVDGAACMFYTIIMTGTE